MINGSVLNIGTFGKGLGNGMSGGFAYQYDPENRIEILHDASSVKYGHISDDSAEAQGHEQFIKYMLEQHVYYTASNVAKILLENWDEERAHFRYLQPLALAQTQSAPSLLKLGHKAIVEELSFAMASYQLTPLKQAYAENKAIFGGKAPAYQEVDSTLSFDLLNAYSVLRIAKQTVHKLAKKRGIDEVNNTLESKAAQNLIKTEDYALLEALAKECKKALDSYDDEQLSLILADKRIKDYKTSLTLRDVQSVNSLGSTAWIIAQDRNNHAAMGDLPDFKELIAEYLVGIVLAANEAA
jgi:glutamate synthase (NADPH/NADH) large chain